MFQPAPIVNITGERVTLGPLRRDLLPVMQRWRNDWVVNRYHSDAPGPQTSEQELSGYEQMVNGADSRTAGFAIYERDGWAPIGVAFLLDIDHQHGTAEYGITIGDASARGRGYGTEVTRLMLDYAFTALGLHNVYLTVSSFNLGGIRAYERAGFREIGRRRECWLLAGRLHDRVYMECLATEFSSPVLASVFVPDSPRR